MLPQLCRELGHEVNEVTKFSSAFHWMQLWERYVRTIIFANVAAWIHGRLEILKRDLRDEDLEPWDAVH